MTNANDSTSSPRRLYLIDGYSNIFRAFYAIRHLTNSRGEPTNAVFGFLQILRKLLREEAPELVGVALDVSRKTVRTEKYEDYKAHRAPMPEDLRPQIPWIRKVLEAYRIPMLEMPNYEADDVLGTLAAKASAEGYDVVLVSADKDLMQLVTAKVSLFHTGRTKVYDPALVEEDFGVPPAQVADVLALMGDTSDNVPGVPGIGQKGAVKLVQEYGSVETLLERAEEIKRKSYREGLQEHRAQAELSKELVTIHCDLDIAFDPDDLHRDPPDNAALREIFAELEFHSLVEELDAAAEQDRELEAAREITTPKAWAEAVAALRKASPNELYLAPVGAESLLGLVVGAAADVEVEGGLSVGVLVDLRRPELREAVLATLGEWFGDEELRLVGHDLKEVLHLVPNDGFIGGGHCRAQLFDLMLASYVLRPALKSHGLDEICLERLHRTLPSLEDAGWQKKQPPEPGHQGLTLLGGERLDALRRLAPQLRQELEEAPALAAVYGDIEAPLVPVLVSMEEAGVLLDQDFLAEMSAELGKEIDALEGEIYRLAGEEFNVNSPQQLGVILFEKLEYPVLRRTRKTKSFSTGAEVLEELAARGYPLPAEILRYRELAKLKSTYVDALPTLVAEDGRIHTHFNQAVAATGRLSSANPNLQNIPVRTELGQRIRKAFVAPPGYRLLCADYSQVELRVLAHIAQEEAMLAAFRAGEDIHRATAAAVFEIDPGMVADEQRRAAKTINFGILYGMSAFGLARNLGIPKAQAAQFIDAYMERYGGVKAYVDETLATAQDEGKVETLYGRARWLPEIHAKNRAVRENAQRMAINARIQGTAADIMKLALIRIHHRLAEESLASRLLLTVHDEVILEVPEAEVDPVSKLVQEEMEGVCTLDAPLVAEVGVGESWYEAK